MTRVRTDNVFGTITDNPLLVGATTMNSAGLANLAAVASAEAFITLDPNRIAGAPEIVVVTAHTGSATSATIQRGQFGTTARQHASGTAWVHGPIAANATTYVTAADDQGDFVPMNAWETYTPTLTQSGAVTKTVTYAKFVRMGRTIVANVVLAVTGAGTANNAVKVGLPVAATTSALVVGIMEIIDASVGTTRYSGTAFLDSTTEIVGICNADAPYMGQTGSDFAVALASGDSIRLAFSYEAAT